MCVNAEQVGDWGRDGHDNQTLVAAAMGKAARDLDFIISTGDNFYGAPFSYGLNSLVPSVTWAGSRKPQQMS